MRRNLALLAALTVLLPSSVPSASPAMAAASVTLVPYPIDSSNQAGWWSPLDAGTATAVQLTSSGSGCARADAVKFVRV